MPIHARKRQSWALAICLPVATGAFAGPDAANHDISCPTGSQSDAAVAQIEGLLATGQRVEALACTERAATAFPGDQRFYRLRVALLSEIGATEQAWTLYAAHPGLFSQEQGERFVADRLARLTTWSAQYASDGDLPLADAERTLAALDAHIERVGGLAQLPPRIRFDRLIALNRIRRHADVVADFRALEAAGLEVPGYALAAVGDSLLAERQPEAAAQVLDKAVASAPDDATLQVLRAWAALEMEDHAGARARLAAFRDTQPPWRRVPGAASGWQNWRRYDADLNHALLLAFGEDLPQAQAQLEARAAVGPGNAGLQSALGTVYLLRGWPTRALERFRMAATLDERAVEARIGQVDALSALRRDDLARPLRDRLLATQGTLPGVQRMERSWRLRRGSQGRVWMSGGRSDGAGGLSPLGSRDRQAGIEAATPLLDDRWRLLAWHEQRRADFNEASVEDRRSGAGVRYAFGPAEAELTVARPHDGPDETAIAAALAWRLDDRWSLRATARRHDADASLQARAAGITADSVGLGIDYSHDERTSWYFSATQWRYDDGNRREALSMDLVQRMVSRPHLLVDGIASAYASRGSRIDAPYFNPTRDASLELAVRADHLLWRRYERQYRHRLTMGVGPYQQRGYGTAWVPRARYEHAWRFAPGREFTLGVEWSRPVYDGQRETRTAFDAGFRWGDAR